MTFFPRILLLPGEMEDAKRTQTLHLGWGGGGGGLQLFFNVLTRLSACERKIKNYP